MAKDENKESEIRGDEQEIVDQRLPVWRPQDADREYYRYETKKRIQHYTVPPQTIFRPAKPTPTIRDAEHKRVAVYARVSTKSKEQVSSIENQTKYYTEKIAKTPNWDLAEIYSDEGKSGTSKKWRPEFKRMLEDASKKKMDLIVCASVSRFARNISDLIEEVRKLRTTNPSNPVGVYFETEDLYTLDPNINERLQMQGLFAEWESGNKSRRMILSYDQRICTGQFPLSDLLGLRHTIEGGFIIEEEEAKTVKYIFLATLCGYTAEEIAEVLTDKQRPTLRGRTEWTASMVKAIMENERRWGDLEVRKRVVIDYKEKVTAKNDGLREGAYIPHYHEGIVSPEIARAAHMMRASRYKFGSVPDVYVIDSGALKGFVSISPTWSGIDNRAFQDISRQVYNEDEFCELQRRANIMNGRTHSNVVSMTLNDYRVAPGVMFMTRSDPQLTFSQRSMKLNAVCWEKLGQQKYVEFLYHPVLEVIAVRSCNATNPNAVLWDETKKSGLQLCTSAFSNAVYDKLDWMRKYKFRFRGVTRVRGGEKIIFFFLDEPQILVGKDKKHLDAMDTSDSTVKYIPYKESECGEAAGLTAGIAYPENWQEQVGVSYEIKQQRGRVLDAVSSADIRNHGTKVVNPFIGVIPTHGELEDELEQIYEAMEPEDDMDNDNFSFLADAESSITGDKTEGYTPKEQELIHQLVQERLGKKNAIEFESLDDYVVPPKMFFSMIKKPAVSIRANRMEFSMSAIRLFEGVQHVLPMLSENKKRMVVAICAEEEISSIEWARLKKDKWVNRSISCPEYVQSIYKMMNWNKECRYKIYGRLANSERGLVLVFDLASAVMFDPLPEEYFDKHTGKMKKRIVKYYPDEIRMKLGRSYSDYEALQQRSSFESLSGYMDTSGGAVPATVSEELAASISMQEQEKKRETLFGTIIGNGGDDDVRNNE